jgi:hypothetical protein
VYPDTRGFLWSARDNDTGQLDKPRQGQPTSGMRFTSQTDQHHHETLDHHSPNPVEQYKSAIQIETALKVACTLRALPTQSATSEFNGLFSAVSAVDSSSWARSSRVCAS